MEDYEDTIISSITIITDTENSASIDKYVKHGILRNNFKMIMRDIYCEYYVIPKCVSLLYI